MSQPWSPNRFSEFYREEHDACGIIASVEKKKIPSNKNIFTCIDALVKMNHRTGFINGEGDGAGIHMDIPKTLWKKKLEDHQIDNSSVDTDGFIVGHFFLSRKVNVSDVLIEIRTKLQEKGLTILFESDQSYNSSALGPIAIQEDPIFWQICCTSELSQQELTNALFDLTISIESNYVHVASLSQYHVVYKVMGAADILPNYFTDLADPLAASTMTLGHNRYSTNTLSSFFRVQPFSVLGHNGVII